jgi:hypothetical protein
MYCCAAHRQAQELLRQMARRQLYKFVQEVTVTPAARRMYGGLPTAEEIIVYQSSAKFDGVSSSCCLTDIEYVGCWMHESRRMYGGLPTAEADHWVSELS